MSETDPTDMAATPTRPSHSGEQHRSCSACAGTVQIDLGEAAVAPASGYQLPLFERFDLSVKFESRMNWIEKRVAAAGEDEDASELVESILNCAEICGLELLQKDTCCASGYSGLMEGTGDAIFDFTYKVPYQGDDDLWILSPCSIDQERPDGEIFRGSLIIVILARDRFEADLCFNLTLRRVEHLIEKQNDRITDFHSGLRRWIWREVIEDRTRRCCLNLKPPSSASVTRH